MDRALLVVVLVGYVDNALAEDGCANCSNVNVGGIAAGCVFGTLAVVGIIALIIWLLNRRRKRKAELGGASGVNNGKTNQTYENRGYDKDIEAGTSHNTQSAPTISPDQYKEKGFGGYVECQEYESPKKNKHAHVSNGHTLGSSNRVKKNLTTLFKTPLQLQKAGSHGSLDNNFPLQDTVTVPLLSQDIIGLGFNIQGSISDGIFVREVHNRGPAKESGAIQPGDRIMSVTIGFENIVHEDALTILSYASPYPVSLELQKPVQTSLIPGTPSEDGIDLDNLNHPVYRSQSYDDVSKITDNEKWIGPRRTWSEMKRGHPMKQSSLDEDQMGSLKKWGATHNIIGQDFNTVTCEVEMNQQSSSDSINVVDELERENGDISGDLAVLNKSLNSGGDVSLNLEDVEGIELDDMEDKANEKLNEGELKINMDDVDANTSDMLDGLSAEDKLDMIKLSYEDPDSVREDDIEVQIKADVQSEVKLSSSTNQLEVGAEVIGETQNSLDEPETIVEIETEAEQARNILNKLGMISSIDADISPSSGATEKENDQDLVVDIPDILVKNESTSLHSLPTDINKNSIEIPNFEKDKSSQLGKEAVIEASEVNLFENAESKFDLDDKQLPTFNIVRNETNDSMAVNVDSSVADLDDSDIMDNEQDDSDEEEEKNLVRSVLKDYFGDKADLLQQFGFEDGEIQVENEGKKESSLSSLSSSPDLNEQQEHVRQTDSPLIQKKSLGGMAFEINSSDFNRMPDESKETPRGKKAKGGMSYFVGIDDKERASLTDPVYYEPPLTSDMPALIKPEEKDRAETPDLFSLDPPSLDITSLRLDTLTTLASISNKEKEVNGKSSMESTPVGSPPQDTDIFSSSDKDIKVDVKARSSEENVVSLSAGGVELNDSTA